MDSGKSAGQTQPTATTIAYYDANAAAFWEGTRDHDVSQNRSALLGAIRGEPPFSLLDLGCGPGRDLLYFRDQGHDVIGLDGSAAFAAMASQYAGVDVWVQDFAALELPEARFDGIFANASLFHVPREAITETLTTLKCSLVPGGVLFCSNPRGNDEEGTSGGRYGCYYRDTTWMDIVQKAGFEPVDRYYRPTGLPREQQPWFATLWRRPGRAE